jgi:hypothetical protein
VFPERPLPVLTLIGWSGGYVRELARRVDQLALMTYDSGLGDERLYWQWSRFQAIQASRVVEGLPVELYLGVPVSKERAVMHNPDVENVRSGIEGLVAGLNDAEARPGQVTGVAIYPHWEADADDWAMYEKLWLGR